MVSKSNAERLPALPSWKYSLASPGDSSAPYPPKPYDWTGVLMDVRRQPSITDSELPTIGVYPYLYYLDSYMAQFSADDQQWMNAAKDKPGVLVSPNDNFRTSKYINFIFQPKRPWNKAEGLLLPGPKSVIIDFQIKANPENPDAIDFTNAALQAIEILQVKLDKAGIFIGGGTPGWQNPAIDSGFYFPSLDLFASAGWLLRCFPMNSYDNITIIAPPRFRIDTTGFVFVNDSSATYPVPNCDPMTFKGGELLYIPCTQRNFGSGFDTTGLSASAWYPNNYYGLVLDFQGDRALGEPIFDVLLTFQTEYIAHDMLLLQQLSKRCDKFKITPYRFNETIIDPDPTPANWKANAFDGETTVFSNMPSEIDCDFPVTITTAEEYTNHLVSKITEFFQLDLIPD